MRKMWKKSKGDSENFVDSEGTVHGHINKHKNNWRAFVRNVPIIDRATKKPKNFKLLIDAKRAVENTFTIE